MVAAREMSVLVMLVTLDLDVTLTLTRTRTHPRPHPHPRPRPQLKRDLPMQTIKQAHSELLDAEAATAQQQTQQQNQEEIARLKEKQAEESRALAAARWGRACTNFPLIHPTAYTFK